MKEKRERFVNVRFTEEEYVNLELQMSLEGYNSRSMYIRKHLFTAPVKHRKFKKFDVNVGKQVEILAANIQKIGINYNQIVKSVNTAVGLRNKQGQPIVSQKSMEYRLSQLQKMMEEILSLVQEMKSMYIV